jgi:hypothetical protein
MSKYPNVKNSHIVPRTYLANWAVDGKIGTVLVPEQRRLVLPVDQVGTRRRFYRRKRPDGTDIDDVEWSLAQGESAATPLLRSFDERWPLSKDEKAQLAELFAYQLLRGTRWKAEYEKGTLRFLERRRDEDLARGLDPDDLDEENAEFLSNSHRLVMMFSTAMTLASALASMHWILIEFARPLVATSDHPVSIWPGAGSSSPEATNVSGTGLINSIEIRLPLSPTRTVLMTWADEPDDEENRVRGTRDHAANLNAFTVASADRQWFHLPDTSPPVGSGKLLPLSVQLVAGYSEEAAEASERHRQVDALVKKRVDRQLDDREITVIWISRDKK